MPVIATIVGEETRLVETVNVPLVEPATIVTLAGTVATPGVALESVTNAPPTPAGPSRVSVPCDVVPPMTLAGLSEIERSATSGANDRTVSGAVIVTPPNEAEIVTSVAPATARVAMVNDSLVEPAATVTLAGTVAGSGPDSAITAPPAGAALESVTIPVSGLPPVTFDALRDSDDRTTAGAATVSVADDCEPPSDAVIVAVPAPPAVAVKVAVVAPAAAVAVAGTVTTAGLLLDSATVAPAAGAAALRFTVPETSAPGAALAGVSTTLDTLGDVFPPPVGPVFEPPHRTVANVTVAIAADIASRLTACLLVMAIASMMHGRRRQVHKESGSRQGGRGGFGTVPRT